MNRSILTVAALGMLAAGANADCVQIGTFAELQAFAATVNGGTTDACGELTANITANTSAILDDNGQLITDDGDRFSGNASNRWEGSSIMENFTGSFNGNTFSISGLYGITALFKSVGTGATLKNIHITDTYIYDSKGSVVAGLVAEVKGDNVIIDSCSFSGTVAAADWTDGGSYIGGLVGKVSSGSVTISNSSVSGRIIAADVNTLSKNLATETLKPASKMGALVGGVESGASVTISSSSATGVILSAAVGDNTSNVGGIVGYNGNADNANVTLTDVTCTNTSGCVNGTTLAEANASMRGVTLAYNGSKLVATLDDSVDSLIIKENIQVDSVVLKRVFTKDAASTLAVPFSIDKENVVGGEMCQFDSLTHNEDGSLKGVDVSAVNTVYAFYAYLIKPTGTQISFKGPITLSARIGGEAGVIDVPGTSGWKIIGVSAKKRWEQATDTTTGENASEIGRVYGFAAKETSAANGSAIGIGDFVKVSNKITVRPMRGFLFYSVGFESKPSASGMSMAPSTDVLSVDELPERLEVVIHYPVTDSTAIETPAENSVEGTDAIQATKVPVVIKQDRYFDMTGRSLKTIKAQGAYINNRTPVIAK